MAEKYPSSGEDYWLEQRAMGYVSQPEQGRAVYYDTVKSIVPTVPQPSAAVLKCLSDGDGTQIQRQLGTVHGWTRREQASNNQQCRDHLRSIWFIDPKTGTLSTTGGI